MSIITNSKSEQARRVLFIYKKLLSGNQFSVHEMINLLSEHFNNISERSIQRDFQIIQNMDDTVEKFREGHSIIWKISNFTKNQAEKINISQDELFSFYVLKAYLKNFKGTKVEYEINRLTSQLENIAPGDALAESLLITEQNFGHYDYSVRYSLILSIIRFINEKTWISFEYTRIIDNKTAIYNVFPYRLYIYSGTIYLIAYYKKKKGYRSFAVQNINNLQDLSIPYTKVPELNLDDFSKQSFGAHTGKPEEISLQIKKDSVKYFENRFWHISQKLKPQKDGSLIIDMVVPIVPELIYWIISWHKAIKILKSSALSDIVKQTLKQSLINFK